MACLRARDGVAHDLINDLVSFIEVLHPHGRHPVKVRKELKKDLERMKIFFRHYYCHEEHDETNKIEEKIVFWQEFAHRMLIVEIKDKPKGMSDEEFLFDVKFEECASMAVEEVMSHSDIF